MAIRHLTLGVLALYLTASISHSSGIAPPHVGAGDDWAHHGGGNDESGFSQLMQITTGNVQRLGLANWVDLDNEVSLEATPVAVDGIVYFSGSRSTVYAVDAANGKMLWSYDPEIWRVNPAKMGQSFGVNRGVAYDNGRVFVGVLDGRLVALDAKTGKEEWSVQTLPTGTYHVITGAPRVFRGKVIIGNGGADSGMRGFVSTYDQATGKLLWRFNVTPGSPEENAGNPAMEMAAKTWTGEFWKVGGGGGTVWNGITFDPEMNRIYLGTGNGGPWNSHLRSPGGGDNLFLASVVALDADTGKYIWHYQENPGESWDYKSVANMVLADLTIGGKARKVIMHAPTNGFFYVIDRESGKLLSAEKIGKVTWADRIDLKTGRPVEAPNIRYETGESTLYPGTIGAHNWQDMSFSPRTGLVYIPTMQLGARYATVAKPGERMIGGITVSMVRDGPGDGTGALLAWDPVAQKARWRLPQKTIWNGGTLSTAGGLVFQGTGDGYLTGYDAASGKKVWQFNAGLGIIAPPISYAVAGRQYMSVLVGYGGVSASLSEVMNYGWKYGAQTRRLLTFALDAKQKLPPQPGPNFTVNALDDPAIKLDEAVIANGRKLMTMCTSCHGSNLQGAGAPGPDLRESAIALSEDDMWSVVHDGALAQRGMPQYANLTREQIHAMWSYIRATAREAIGTRAKSEKMGIDKM